MSSKPRLSERRGFGAVIWVVAIAATLSVFAYQKRTGPTHPIPVKLSLGGGSVRGELPRSHPGPGDQLVSLEAPSGVSGQILWRHYPRQEPWMPLDLKPVSGRLEAGLPHQPPAGKLEYRLQLASGGEMVVLPPEEAAIIRFRGEVPAWVIIPHILAMFLAFSVGFRAALGALLGDPRLGRLIPYTLAILIPGGLVLGPVVQKFAFGEFWTGWPVGGDWTDTKTLIAVVGWSLAALVWRRRERWTRPAVLLASVIMLVVYLIPHSIHGSQLDWEQMTVETGRIPVSSETDSSEPGGIDPTGDPAAHTGE